MLIVQKFFLPETIENSWAQSIYSVNTLGQLPSYINTLMHVCIKNFCIVNEFARYHDYQTLKLLLKLQHVTPRAPVCRKFLTPLVSGNPPQGKTRDQHLRYCQTQYPLPLLCTRLSSFQRILIYQFNTTNTSKCPVPVPRHACWGHTCNSFTQLTSIKG